MDDLKSDDPNEIASDADGNRSERIQDFIFARELSEVYLLLDHISGRWDKNFSSFETLSAQGNPDPTLIEKICKIAWPWPKGGTDAQRAEEAALLIRAKDKLNAAAQPATGATIAFTLLVVGDDDNSKQSWWRGWQHKHAEKEPAAKSEGNHWPTRMSLARTAFPGLVSTAANFEAKIKWILSGLTAVLILTCYVSWSVVASNTILADLDALHAKQLDITKKIAAAENEANSASANQPNKAHLVSEGPTMPFVRYCQQPHNFLSSFDTARSTQVIGIFQSIDEAHLCEDLRRSHNEHRVMDATLTAWLSHWAWLKFGQRSPSTLGPISNAYLVTGAKIEDRSLENNGNDEEAIRVLTKVLATVALPFLYGILGAGTAIVRDLWAKMRDSMLSPRDYTLALAQLALGAIIGACIGLFFNPAVGPPSGSGGFGTVTLTGSALSFVAGFGVESVFMALESLVKRIFNTQDKARKM